MAVIGTIAAAVGEMAKAFGNVTGVIENNIRSATSISDLSRERGVLSTAESLLIEIIRWHTSNTRTLWLLGQWAANGNNFDPRDLEQHTRELELFANDLSRTKVLLGNECR